MAFSRVIRVFTAGVFAAFVGLACLPSTALAQSAWTNGQWPRRGAVEYQVSLGEGGAVVGKGRHTWAHNGSKYNLQLNVETAGIAALVAHIGYVEKSTGSVGAAGLVPARLDVTQLNKKPQAAVFDWRGKQVSIRKAERERKRFALTAGDQDVLSLWHQVGRIPSLPARVQVVAQSNAHRAKVTRLADENTRVPAGRFATCHYRVASLDGRIQIDLWLATGKHLVPVRAILADTKNKTLLLEATSIDLK